MELMSHRHKRLTIRIDYVMIGLADHEPGNSEINVDKNRGFLIECALRRDDENR